jgi:hypothetical protein
VGRHEIEGKLARYFSFKRRHTIVGWPGASMRLLVSTKTLGVHKARTPGAGWGDGAPSRELLRGNKVHILELTVFYGQTPTPPTRTHS